MRNQQRKWNYYRAIFARRDMMLKRARELAKIAALNNLR